MREGPVKESLTQVTGLQGELTASTLINLMSTGSTAYTG